MKMTGLIRRQPWSILNQLHTEMDNLFHDRTSDSENYPSAYASDWVPAVDVKEENDRYLIHADIPGVDPKDISVEMHNGVLSIKGERKHKSKEARENFSRVERVSGTFYRRFNLPDTVNGDGITAKGLNGVLEIIIPKTPVQTAKKITVES